MVVPLYKPTLQSHTYTTCMLSHDHFHLSVPVVMVSQSNPSQFVEQTLLDGLGGASSVLPWPQLPFPLPHHVGIEVTHVGFTGVVNDTPPHPAMLAALEEGIWNNHQTCTMDRQMHGGSIYVYICEYKLCVQILSNVPCIPGVEVSA